MSLEISKKVQNGYLNLGTINMCMVFKSMGMDEIAYLRTLHEKSSELPLSLQNF